VIPVFFYQTMINLLIDRSRSFIARHHVPSGQRSSSMEPYFRHFHIGSHVIFHKDIELEPGREEIDPVHKIAMGTVGTINKVKIRNGRLFMSVHITDESYTRGWNTALIYQAPNTIGCAHQCFTCKRRCHFAGVELHSRYAELGNRAPCSQKHTRGELIDPFDYWTKEEYERVVASLPTN